MGGMSSRTSSRAHYYREKNREGTRRERRRRMKVDEPKGTSWGNCKGDKVQQQASVFGRTPFLSGGRCMYFVLSGLLLRGKGAPSPPTWPRLKPGGNAVRRSTSRVPESGCSAAGALAVAAERKRISRCTPPAPHIEIKAHQTRRKKERKKKNERDGLTPH